MSWKDPFYTACVWENERELERDQGVAEIAINRRNRRNLSNITSPRVRYSGSDVKCGYMAHGIERETAIRNSHCFLGGIWFTKCVRALDTAILQDFCEIGKNEIERDSTNCRETQNWQVGDTLLGDTRMTGLGRSFQERKTRGIYCVFFFKQNSVVWTGICCANEMRDHRKERINEALDVNDGTADNKTKRNVGCWLLGLGHHLFLLIYVDMRKIPTAWQRSTWQNGVCGFGEQTNEGHFGPSWRTTKLALYI